MSLGCLCFVLIGCPAGIWFRRADYLGTFVGCFLPVAFVYYFLSVCGVNLARKGRLPASIAVWTGEVILILVALLMIRRLAKS